MVKGVIFCFLLTNESISIARVSKATLSHKTIKNTMSYTNALGNMFLVLEETGYFSVFRNSSKVMSSMKFSLQ